MGGTTSSNGLFKRGRIVNCHFSVSGGSCTSSSKVIATVPTGFIPGYAQTIFGCVVTSSANVYGYISIGTDGKVSHNLTSQTITGAQISGTYII